MLWASVLAGTDTHNSKKGITLTGGALFVFATLACEDRRSLARCLLLTVCCQRLANPTPYGGSDLSTAEAEELVVRFSVLKACQAKADHSAAPLGHRQAVG